MRRRRRAACLVAVGLAAVPCGVIAGPREEFDALESKLIALHEQFQKKNDQADRRIPLETDKNDPRLEVLRQMDQLAVQTLGKPEGAYIAIWTFNYSWQLDLDLANLLARFERVAGNDISDASVSDVLAIVPEAYQVSGTPGRWIELLEKIAVSTSRESTRHDALLNLGLLQLKERMLPQARATFAKLAELAAGDSEFARHAKGYLFEIDRLQEGMTAPDFAVKDLSGKEIRLSSLRGKVVLVNFWATWCVPCLAEIPQLKELVSRVEREGQSGRFEILSISLDDFREMLDSVLEAKKPPGIQTWDQSGRANPAAELYNVQKLPVLYLIDAAGVIRKKNPPIEELPSLVLALIGEGSPNKP